MTSADQWIAEYDKHGDDWKWICKIQLDAMREGMKRAEKVADQWCGNPYMAQHDIQKAILSAANSLTDQDIAAITGTTLAK